MQTVSVLPVGCLSDNYAWLVVERATGTAVVVDPGAAPPVLEAMEAAGARRLARILLTHHHPDHTGGVAELRAETGARVACSRLDAGRVPEAHDLVEDGDAVALGALAFRALAVPGHTAGHLAWHLVEADGSGGWLFSGDTLFSLGCGRLFEGSARQMWASLRRLRALPGDTRLCCGHEYTLANARFARTILGGDPAFEARLDEVERRRGRGLPTVPVALALERVTNPFLRADDPAVARRVGLAGAPPEAVFAELRQRKDGFAA